MINIDTLDPDIPVLDESFSQLNSEALMQNYAMKTSQINLNRGRKIFTSQEEKLMSELESNALKLARARQGI